MEQNEVKRQSVLVVEDEPFIAAVCVRTLTAEGFQSGRCGKWRDCLRDVEEKRL